MVARRRPAGPRLRPPRRRRRHARGAGAGGDVDRVHLAGDRHRLRAPLRRPQAARRLAAAPVRPAGRQGRRAAAGRGAAARRCSPLVGQLLGWDPPLSVPPVVGAVLAVLLGTAAFAVAGPADGRRAPGRGDPGGRQPGLPPAAGRRRRRAPGRRRTARFGDVARGCPPARSARRCAQRSSTAPSRGATWRSCSAGRSSAPCSRPGRSRGSDAPVRTQRWVRPLAWATLVANIGPRRHRRRRPAHRVRARLPDLAALHRRVVPAARRPRLHQAIEFGNRTLTFVLVAIAIATFVVDVAAPAAATCGSLALLIGARHPRPGGDRRDHGAHRPQPVGGLAPPALLAGDHRRRRTAAAQRRRAPPPAHRGPTVALAWATFGPAWAVLYVGTVVTGCGPHAGDATPSATASTRSR